MSLEGRLALVTGGSRGIGRGIALGLAEDGADVLVNYRRDEASALETVAAIEALGRRAQAVQASVDDHEQLDRMVQECLDGLGAPCIVVHNAGIASRGHSVEDTDPAELQRVMAVHALGPHYLTKILIPHLRQHERADVVMISSVATLGFSANGAPYSMAKSAMEALAKTLAKELRADGIRVNIVAPGLVETEMGTRLVRATRGVEIGELHEKSPFGRVCQPEDIAGAVRFFVSSNGSYVTGEKLNVWGGG